MQKLLTVDLGLLILRLSLGLTMLFAHGLPKLMNYSAKMNTFPDPLGVGNSFSLALAVFSEFICAALISLGVFTRYTVIPLIITFFVIFFVVHGTDPFGKRELAFIYLCGYIALFFTDGGKLSLDRLFRK
ncbi:DoxX family protein [Bacteriovoracaceae bacterium]|nr:DoxX family protein [Bacteriovoracaceae bacterium]|tara:strand:- start:29818 stop:30207 length:390 start_codon:yes stop_codon:yes gene_type:complete